MVRLVYLKLGGKMIKFVVPELLKLDNKPLLKDLLILQGFGWPVTYLALEYLLYPFQIAKQINHLDNFR